MTFVLTDPHRLFPYSLPVTLGLSSQDLLDYQRGGEGQGWRYEPRWWERIPQRERRLLAARRIGELVPKPTPQESGEKGGRGKKAPEVRQPLPITHQRLSEFRKLAAWRIGELVPAGEHGGKGGGTKSEIRTSPEIPKQRLSDFRKLAEVPLEKFKERSPGSEVFGRPENRGAGAGHRKTRNRKR